jgi:acetyltransferase-like isoleucine patch superfamily enzyme
MGRLTAKLREGRGPVWRPLKRLARGVLSFHVPVAGPTRHLFRLGYRLHVAARETLAWALRFFWYEPLFRGQCVSVGPGFRMEQLPYIQGAGRIVIGRDVRLSGKPAIQFSGRYGRPPELVIGDGSFVGHGCGFHVGSAVRIGRHCLLAAGVQVFDLDGHPLDAAARRAGEPTPAEAVRPVEIGDDAWIGSGALILKGVTVGERSVVAARAVVTADVPPDVVVAGNPARVVRTLTAAEPVDRAAYLNRPEPEAVTVP